MVLYVRGDMTINMAHPLACHHVRVCVRAMWHTCGARMAHGYRSSVVINDNMLLLH